MGDAKKSPFSEIFSPFFKNYFAENPQFGHWGCTFLIFATPEPLGGDFDVTRRDLRG